MTNIEAIEKIIKKKGGRLNYTDLNPELKEFYEYFKIRAQESIHSIYKQLSGISDISFDIIEDYSFNAFATGVGNFYFIGINRGTIATLALVFDRYFADRALFPFIGNIENESSDLPIIKNIALNYEYTVDELPYFEPPQDPTRNAVAKHLTKLAIDFILAHEIAHIILGHVDYLNSEYNIILDELSHSETDQTKNKKTRKSLEMDADAWATTILLSSEMRRVIGKLPIQGKEWKETYNRPGIVITYFTFAIATIFRIYGDQRLDNSKFENETYPQPRLRYVISMLQIAIDPDFLKLNEKMKFDLDKNGVPITVAAGFNIIEDAFNYITGKKPSTLSIIDAWGAIGFTQLNTLIDYWNFEIKEKLEKYSYIKLSNKVRVKL